MNKDLTYGLTRLEDLRKDLRKDRDSLALAGPIDQEYYKARIKATIERIVNLCDRYGIVKQDWHYV